ncbi:MAG: MBOAT family protein [Planctomycetota bacterium]|nr:MBOAT family protein [Planctomycetota bacterium]
MLFHTWTFLAFFAIVYPIYLAIKGTRLRLPWLLLSSYVFYGWWNPVYLLLVAGATVVDWLAVIGMAKTRWKKPWVALSVGSNLSLLGFFKYGKWVIENLNAVAHWLGIPYTLANPDVRFISDGVNAVLHALGLSYSVPAFEYLLPVGISFFAFQSMSYCIDFYRGKVDRAPSLLCYATFVAFFPQLVAGPIERASNLLPQLREAPRITWHDVGDGLSLFVVGLFKKVALADYLAPYVDRIYASPSSHEASALLLATVAFAWQIYFDFSGYTDMARGVGRLLGARLLLNFNNPYLATGLGDFWRRWHISLSTWFRDYVYLPLGGNRRGEFRTYVNMVLTMLLSGLWHGALWTFVMWGAVHAVGRVVTRGLEDAVWYRDRVPTLAKQFLTFSIVTLAWVFFRAQSVSDAWLILRRIASGGLTDPAFPLWMGGLVCSIWLYQYLYESRLSSWLRPAPVRIALVVAMVLYMATCVTSSGQTFIYFQF